jgi:Bax protein
MRETTRMNPGAEAAPMSSTERSAIAVLVLVLLGALVLPTLFVHLAYRAPESEGVEQFRAMPDFAEVPAGPERKRVFIEFLAPLLQDENERVLQTRRRLERIDRAPAPSAEDLRWLADVAERYETPFDPADPRAALDRLLIRVDAIPVSLAVAQAAIESGWGSSRFAREGFNFYGQRCYRPGCGIVPRRRAEGASWEVARFASPTESVRSYLRNLNTFSAYEALRKRRAELRDEGGILTGVELVDGLDRYSERGFDYLTDVRRLILGNRLLRFDPPGAGDDGI